MKKTKKCYICENKLTKDDIGLNKKLLDRGLSRFMCMGCLAAHLDVPVEDLRAKVDEFKEQGCTLFL